MNGNLCLFRLRFRFGICKLQRTNDSEVMNRTDLGSFFSTPRFNFLKRIHILLILFILINSLFAQKPIILSEIEIPSTSILHHIEIFCDSSNTLEIDHIRSEANRAKFSPSAEFTDTLYYDHTYWLHFVIDPQGTCLQPAGLFIPKENHLADLYIISDSLITVQRTGLYVDGEDNSEIIPFSNILQLQQNKTAQYYLRIRNTYAEPPDFQLSLVDINTRIKKNNRKILFDAMHQGMMWLMILYGLFLYFLNRDKIYIFYSLYVFFQSVFILGCFAFSYRFIYNLPRSIFIYTDIPSFIAFIFYIQFVRSFINLTQILPTWDRVLRIVQLVFILLVIGIPVAHYTSEATITVFTIQNSILWLLMLFFIVFTIRLILSKNTLAVIIGIGTSLLIIGSGVTMVLMLIHNSYYEDSLFIPNKLGITLELIAFTFGISYRYLLIEKEKRTYQQKLIVQLNENAELQQKVTRELEDKVRERTNEIRQKNELLEQQKEEVEAQRDEIETQRDQLKIQRDLVVSQKKEITDSINYAQHIQSAILPPQSYVKTLIPEYFILFKPRDIVSGDFYWIKEINNSLIVVGADCTGHGVPGGFMSMLGVTLLNDVVGHGSIGRPSEMLDQLRIRVKEILAQEGKLQDQKDGMDMAICMIDKKKRELQFAGANHPLYLIRKNHSKASEELVPYATLDHENYMLFEVKGDKQPIGVHWEETDFTNHHIPLQEDDVLYIFSDGIVDQYGGEHRKKYKALTFKRLLLSIQHESMEDQKQLIEHAFETWRGNNEQIDDIFVIGVKV